MVIRVLEIEEENWKGEKKKSEKRTGKGVKFWSRADSSCLRFNKGARGRIFSISRTLNYFTGTTLFSLYPQ